MNRERWNQFIIKNNGSFLQSWSWGQYQEAIGHKIWRIQADDFNVLLIKHDLPFAKNYLYCPRPVFKNLPDNFLNQVRQIAKQEKSIFFKIELDRDLNKDSFPGGLLSSSKHIQPLKTIILDLHKSEEELLSRMHQKTRYNIRLAQKKGVSVEQNQSDIGSFLELLSKTTEHDKFYSHPKDHYLKMVDVLGKANMLKIFLAKRDNKIIAGSINLFWNKTAIYSHGASDYNYRNLMAPYLLQWEAIKQAKVDGFQYYDFFGIDERKWPGVTRFKNGFNGQEISYPGAFDLIFQPVWYKAYNLIRKIL